MDDLSYKLLDDYFDFCSEPCDDWFAGALYDAYNIILPEGATRREAIMTWYGQAHRLEE